MKDLGITKGKWLIDGDFIFSDEFDIAGVIVGDMPKDQVKSNTKLIADAGTTANKCGLLPSELLAQRDELLEALEEIVNIFNPDKQAMYEFVRKRIEKAKQVINKVTE